MQPDRTAIEHPLHHGGRLRQAAEHYHIPLSQWLDLSTGINPNGWPVPALPASCWSRLPEENDGLENQAERYYRAPAVLPVAGSQAAIQILPRLRGACRVSVIAPGYAEHAAAWKQHGHAVTPVSPAELEDTLPDCDVLVLINPNNPSGTRFTPQQLLDWHRLLQHRNGWLVVDEAFMDATPEDSVASFSHQEGLIVLRSPGKFFGLAGARIGFVCAAPQLLVQLAQQLGPWAVSGPARQAARLALADSQWQQQTRENLLAASSRLAALLQQQGLPPAGGTRLFQWVQTGHASEIHDSLAQLGILTRLFEQPASLRFGLPANTAGFTRLENALKTIPGRLLSQN